MEPKKKVNKNKIMLFDLETTGFPKKKSKHGSYYNYKESDKYESSRIVQMSWRIHKPDGKKLLSKDYIIKPDGFVIPNNVIKIHGITNKIANDKGVNIEDVLIELLNDTKKVNTIVAHCMNFDYNVLLAELFKCGQTKLIKRLEKCNLICTGEATKNLLKLPVNQTYTTINDEYKMPRLSELYSWCFKKEMKNHHNSKYDTKNLAKIFFYLKEKYNLETE